MIRHFNTRALLVVERMVDPAVHEVMNRVRAMPGVDVEPLGPHAGRAVLRALRRNHIVVLGGDRAISENNVSVRFFGRLTPMPSGPATLALRTGAPLMTGVAPRLPDDRTLAIFDPPLLIDQSDTSQDAVRDVTQKIAYSMEAYIRRDPAQWLVAERVWSDA
jgi:phosphatidylinositol dimannoside acyltransferase